MSEEVRKVGDIVCLGDKRKPHVLARVTLQQGKPLDLNITPGVKWFATETSGGASITFTCRHGWSEVDLMAFAAEVGEAPRRIRRTVNA